MIHSDCISSSDSFGIMKRRQRRPVLDLNNQGGSHESHPQNKSNQSNNDNSSQNTSANPLANLLSQYDSDSDNDEPVRDVHKLDDQVNNFLKEIQLIAPKETASELSNSSISQSDQQSSCKWRECIDESSGYPYYWHIETNEVTWEMPSELKALKSTTKVASVNTVQESRWVDFSSITYQQSHENIPEGMIPREVVARNRNRYGSSDQIRKQKEQELAQEAANNSDAAEDETEDGRIEMITSYGSESDSDTENNESIINETSSPRPDSSPKPISRFRNNDTMNSPKVNLQSDSNLRSKLKRKRSKLRMRSVKEEIVRKEHLEEESLCKKDKRNHESDIDFRVSLVPGYEMDSENEEESEHKQERKCLFPIPHDETSETSSFKYKKLPSSLAKVIAPEESRTDSNDSTIEKNADKVEEVIAEKTEEEAKSEKTNKFLEALQEQTKGFQRKRRIAFDGNKIPRLTEEDEITVDSLSPVPAAKVKVTEPEKSEAIPDTKDEASTEAQTEVQNEENEVDKVKEEESEEIAKETEEGSNSPKENDVKSEADVKEEEVNPLAQIIQEKLKFLSEGKQMVSPVQTMSIQLQTLFVAWEGGYLEKNYLHRWLTETSHELERLEQDAAPPGWLCQWDRSHKRYYYQNASTGATQWTYPDTGIAGGTEEMEICSTPPPAEQEDIVSSVDNDDSKKQSTKSKKSKEEGENGSTEEHRPSELEAPPPPQISNPSPPPPPRIFAEDLKKDKKKKDKEGSSTEMKSEVSSTSQPLVQPSVSPQTTVIPSIGNTEPLPPGVDLSDAPYEIPATALKRILYNTVQGASLYEAATRDPTVPILGHPMVQEHYLQYPAYHQHLHAQQALVLPHKHGVQPAIQLIPDYTSIYTNHKVIEKPPVKTQKESLVSALDSFYSEVAQIEKSEQTTQKQEPAPVEPPAPPPVEEPKVEVEPEQPSVETPKEKKKKKARVAVSKKHKEVSSMVAKWQRAQQNLDDNT